jgi:UTP--glucose-1-phosphate uridylyltransferase
MNKVKKAVIPAAGFGTRVEEAVAAGITDILMVVSSGKQSIQEHFTANFALEQRLETTGQLDILEDLRRINKLANIHYIYQQELNGLGDAIYYAKSFVGNDLFAVLLGDTVVTSETVPPTGQLIAAYEKTGASVVALEEVPWEKVNRYGVIDGRQVDERLFEVKHLVEKPAVNKAPSNLVIASRYIFTPEIFTWLEQIPRGKGNEIQLTDAMSLMLKQQSMYGFRFDGKRHDIGNKLDFVKATVEFALKRPEFEFALREYLQII